MNDLVKALLEGLIEVNEFTNKKIVGMFGGGFKPPTSGHLEVVKRALAENPEMDELIILVGSGTRDSISQEESLAIWNMYKKYLPSKVTVMASPKNKPPIGAIYSYARKNPNEIVYFFVGAREGNEEDFQDIEKRTRSLRKLPYQNVKVKQIVTGGAVSGTKARQALLANNKEEFLKYIPDIPEADEIWDMLKDIASVNEAVAHEMSMEDFNDVGEALRNPKKAKAIYGLLLQMFPKQKEVIDYNYKNDAFAEMKRVIHGIDKYKLIGPVTVQPKEMKLAPEVEAEREKKFQQFVKGEIDKYFRTDKTDPRKVDVSKFPPITMDEEGFVSDGNHRAFIAKKQNKPLKAYRYIAAKNDHPNVAKILKLVGRSLNERVRFTPDFVTQGDVEFVDDFADRKLAPIDVDLTGNHFFDRLNDPRNRPDISVEELEEFFDKLADEKEDFIKFLRQYRDVVVKDTDTDINIPFMKRANKAIAKTIMRKKNFMTSNKVLPLEEGRYDREVTTISNMIVNYFKDVFGKKTSETFEDAGELGNDTYNLIVNFIPSDFETLGPLPFIINAAAGENDMAIQIDYQPAMFPGAYNELIPELKDAIRHELEHIAQYRFDKDAFPGDVDQDDLPLVDYLTLDYEIPAFVQGIYKKAKTKKISFTDALDEFLDDRLDELDPKEVARVRRTYIAYAKKNLPAAQIDENGQKVSDKNMDDYKKQNNPSGKVKDPFGINAYARELALLREISIDLSNYSGQILPGDVLRAPKGFPLGGKKLEKSKVVKVIKNSREGVNRYKLTVEDQDGKRYTVRNFEMDGEYKGKKLPKFGLIRRSKKNLQERDPKTGTGKKPKGSGRRLYTDEDPSDTVKVKFSTRQDIVNTLNKASFKSKSHARQSQVINLIHQRVRAALSRTKDPKKKKRLQTAFNYIKKRKEASKAKTKRLQAQKKKKKANENIAPNHNQKSAPYGSGYKPLKEDLTPAIVSLTQYMGSNGLDLKPYPKVKFIDNNEENADNILGRTAYYDPNEQLVALYTMNRHPKDILRSYAHELVHHHQNLNNTLDHSQTTNTNADNNLDKIEREAYETGNILFRNWEDSIKNEK